MLMQNICLQILGNLIQMKTWPSYHPGLAGIPAPVGSQDVMSQMRDSPAPRQIFTTFFCQSVPIRNKDLFVWLLQLPGTQQVQEFLLTHGDTSRLACNSSQMDVSTICNQSNTNLY